MPVAGFDLLVIIGPLQQLPVAANALRRKLAGNPDKPRGKKFVDSQRLRGLALHVAKTSTWAMIFGIFVYLVPLVGASLKEWLRR